MNDIPPLFLEWTLALPKEPKFGLRGSDPEAPDTILFWVASRRARVLTQKSQGVITEEKANHELDQCTQAEQIAWTMLEWQKGHMDESEAHIPERAKRTQKDALDHAKNIEKLMRELDEALYFLQQISPIKPPPHYKHSIKHLGRMADDLRKAYRGLNQLKELNK